MTASSELWRALGALCEPPHPSHRRIADALCLPAAGGHDDYAEVFLFQLYPYASVYVGPEGMLGGEAADRVAGFWRALRLSPPPEPDHLAALLGLYAALIEAEAAEDDRAAALLRRRSRKAFLWEHLLSWAIPYLEKVIEIAPPFYRAWGELLRETLLAEADEVGPLEALPLQLRAAPGLPDPEDGGEDWVGALVAPVRSGMILTRRDLGRAARELGLGLRMGERAFALRSMLEQDHSTTVGWLAREAEGWAARHRAMQGALGDVAEFWRERVEAVRALLLASAAAAREKEVVGHA